MSWNVVIAAIEEWVLWRKIILRKSKEFHKECVAVAIPETYNMIYTSECVLPIEMVMSASLHYLFIYPNLNWKKSLEV